MSAAADWSRFPLGTRFQIVGTQDRYVIDDYGGALVGTNTIDLYKTSRRGDALVGCPARRHRNPGMGIKAAESQGPCAPAKEWARSAHDRRDRSKQRLSELPRAVCFDTARRSATTSPMKVLVVGGAGYIGSVCAELLLNEGHTVGIFDNLTEGHRRAVDARATVCRRRSGRS